MRRLALLPVLALPLPGCGLLPQAHTCPAVAPSELTRAQRLDADVDLYKTTVAAIIALRRSGVLEDDAALVADASLVELWQNIKKRRAALDDPQAAEPTAYDGYVSAFQVAIYRLIALKTETAKRTQGRPVATQPAR